MDESKLQKAQEKAYELHEAWWKRRPGQKGKVNTALINKAIGCARIYQRDEQQKAFAIIRDELLQSKNKTAVL